jgi:hypothetical protein
MDFYLFSDSAADVTADPSTRDPVRPLHFEINPVVP